MRDCGRCGLRAAAFAWAWGLCLWAAAAPVAQRPLAEALRLPGLSEHIAKLHVQAVEGVLPQRGARALASALAAFDSALRAARAHAPPEARDSYLLVAILWREYRALAARPPTRATAGGLAERAEEIAWIASKGLTQWARPDARGSRALLAAHAGMLSQKAARLHLPRSRIAGPAARERSEILGALGATLGRLRSLRDAAPGAEGELEVAGNQWVFLERAAEEVAAGGAAPGSLEVIAKTADNILESMDRLARLYAAEGG